LPSIQSPLGALPSRFRRERLLIVGCGDIGLRVAQLAKRTVRLLALTSSPERKSMLRLAGVTPLDGNLDDLSTLLRLAGIATRVLQLAPPPQDGKSDTRTKNLVRVLARRHQPHALVYGSTSGVYGDCQGAWVQETRGVHPQTARAVRRVDAERHVRFYGRSTGVAVSILRIPGIYAANRDGVSLQARLDRKMPVLVDSEDVYTNHIHADDLARACMAALWRNRRQRVFNVCDDTRLKMGDYFDLVAKIHNKAAPPRVSRAQAEMVLSPMQLSFMGESRLLDNHRMKAELRLKLRYPHVEIGLATSTV
jgi:nucleoside-diphosphate-sugar epimerase